MAFTAIDLVIGGLVGFGASEVISGMTKTPSGPDKAALPDPTKASASASNTVANQRATLLAAGGQTDFTGGLGVLTGSDVSKTSLVGG